ncbi:unnamed protein product [Symbiodinium necroappetens]|uniref:Uncharacterized protein n=1 Tax=Symbiodinium necroappetens TaxID=1628268 RepID=A0A813A580_9DINO|nr:unnamed protein product [Symbiodinium necroappetens]
MKRPAARESEASVKKAKQAPVEGRDDDDDDEMGKESGEEGEEEEEEEEEKKDDVMKRPAAAKDSKQEGDDDDEMGKECEEEEEEEEEDKEDDVMKRPAASAKSAKQEGEDDGGEEQEEEEEEDDEEQNAEEQPQDQQSNKVKAHWGPKFRELAKRINQKDGLTMGWNRFENVEAGPVEGCSNGGWLDPLTRGSGNTGRSDRLAPEEQKGLMLHLIDFVAQNAAGSNADLYCLDLFAGKRSIESAFSSGLTVGLDYFDVSAREEDDLLTVPWLPLMKQRLTKAKKKELKLSSKGGNDGASVLGSECHLSVGVKKLSEAAAIKLPTVQPPFHWKHANLEPVFLFLVKEIEAVNEFVVVQAVDDSVAATPVSVVEAWCVIDLMPVAIDVAKILEQARKRSYDSSKEDAQNPFPEYEDTPPGKRAFQSGKAGKEPLRLDSAQTVVVETPPPKPKRAGTDDLSGSLSKKVRNALRRPQSVDQESDSQRQHRAKTTQKKLEQDFQAADDSQNTQDPDAKDEANTSSPASTKASTTRGKAKAKAKGAAKSVAKKKGTAEHDESEAPTKSMKDSGKKGKAKESEAQDSGKKGKAEESEAPTKPTKDSRKEGKAEESEAPTKPKKDSGKKATAQESEAPTKPKKDSGKKRKAEDVESESPSPPKAKKHSSADSPRTRKAQEDHRTATSSKDPMPSPKKSTSKQPPSPDKKKQGKEDESKEEQSLEEKKKTAHKMYMRFYRNVHGKNKMSSLYEDFLQTEGDWTKSMILKTIKSITRNGRRGIRRWQTRSQLINHFGDTKIVDSIIARKETDEHLRKTEMRKHPDCPGLVQYLVLMDEEVTDEDVDEITDMFRAKDGAQSDDSSGSDDDHNDKPDSKRGKDREAVSECFMNESVGG